MIWLPICMSTPVISMPGSRAAQGVDLAGASDRNAELVLRFAGGDFLVGLCVDVGIDADRDRRRHPLATATSDSACNSGSDSTLKHKISLSSANAISPPCLADAREDDALAGHPRCQGPAQFAFGDDVHAGAEFAQRR